MRHLRRSLVTRAATDPVWIDNDYALKFYAECPSCRNPPHLSGLGTGNKRHRNVPPMTGFKWKGSKAWNIGGGCKIFYNGADRRKNGIGIVLRKELAENVLEVKRVSDRLMGMKLEVKGSILNIVSAYAPQVNNIMEEKNDFWEDLDGLMESIPKEERIVLGADLNGHVGEGNIGDEEIMERYGAGTRNKEGSMVVDFGKRMDLAIVNTYFKKKEEYRVTYKVEEKVPKQIM